MAPKMEAGETTSDETAPGSSVNVALWVTPPQAAEIVTGVEAATAGVVVVNFADVAPAGTVTLAGADADGDELCRVTIEPPAGAAPVRVTVFRVVVTPPTVDVGDRTTDETA